MIPAKGDIITQRDGVTYVWNGTTWLTAPLRPYRPPVDARKHYNASPQRLRALLNAAELSTREAARMLGVPDRSMRRWLNGDESAPYPVQVCLELLAEQLNRNVVTS